MLNNMNEQLMIWVKLPIQRKKHKDLDLKYDGYSKYLKEYFKLVLLSPVIVRNMVNEVPRHTKAITLSDTRSVKIVKIVKSTAPKGQFL